MKGSGLQRTVQDLDCHAGCSPPLVNQILVGTCPICGVMSESTAWNEQSDGWHRTYYTGQWSRMYSKRNMVAGGLSTGGPKGGSYELCCPACGTGEISIARIVRATPNLPEMVPALMSIEEVRRLASVIKVAEATRLLT